MHSSQRSILGATLRRAVSLALVCFFLTTVGCIERIRYEDTSEQAKADESEPATLPEPPAPSAQETSPPTVERGDNYAFVEELDSALTVDEQPPQPQAEAEPDDLLAEDLFGSGAPPSQEPPEVPEAEKIPPSDDDTLEFPITSTAPASEEPGFEPALPEMPDEPTSEPTIVDTEETGDEELTLLLPEPSQVPQVPPAEEMSKEPTIERPTTSLALPTERPSTEPDSEVETPLDGRSPPLDADDYATIDLVPLLPSSTPPLELPSTETATANEPPTNAPSAAVRRDVWLLGSRLSLARLASQIGASPQATARRWEEVESLADQLDVPRPVRRGYRGPTAVPNDRRAELDALVSEGQELGARIAAKYGPENAALFETALKSNLLLVLLGPDEPLVDTIIQAVDHAATRAQLPSELWKPTLEQLAKRPHFTQVERLVFQLHENVADYLSDELPEPTGESN